MSVHLLGYLFDPEHPAIVAEQTRLRAERVERLRRMIEKMAADGYPVDVETVFALLPAGASAGRPHLARALVTAGVVDVGRTRRSRRCSTTAARTTCPRPTPRSARAIEMVRAAGGVAVFAHPLARKRGRVVEPSVIVELSAVGLAGVEVDHPDHAPEDRDLLRGLAADAGLVPTGSSDYHGTNKTIPIGAETTGEDAFASAGVRGHRGRDPHRLTGPVDRGLRCSA